MKITIAQLNPVIGDIDGNLEKIDETVREFGTKSDLIVFPELFLVGYPPRDILEQPGFIKKTQAAIEKIIAISGKCPNTGILFGVPLVSGSPEGKGLYNSAVLIHKSTILAYCHKSLLPTYDVFDETRYFDSAVGIDVIPFKGEKLGISICEDMWNDTEFWPNESYAFNPIEKLVQQGATVLINLSASPFHTGKQDIRYKIVQNHVKKYSVPFLFVNQVGGNDELIFDGRSFCVDKKGDAVSVFPSFMEHVEIVDIEAAGTTNSYKTHDEIESVYEALVLGASDYAEKCGFSTGIIGLSGGIDSAVVCAVAKEAMGKDNVLSVYMPSLYSAGESEKYSRKLVRNLGIGFKIMPISGIYNSYIENLKKELLIDQDKEVEVYLQNVQARIRGNILMAFSNKFGYLLFTTGNKSELAVGYCTLYGDMAGGLAVISDVPKTMVYQLAEYINRDKEIIPVGIIKRPPSAELKPGQLDQDTLPPYDVLDKILYLYLERGFSLKKIIAEGFEPNIVRWVIREVNRNEYKRRQASPGLKITSKAFGIGRRMPIAAVNQNC